MLGDVPVGYNPDINLYESQFSRTRTQAFKYYMGDAATMHQLSDAYSVEVYDLEMDWSSNSYLAYRDDNWSYYSVGTSNWSNWGDVVEKGESSSDGDVDIYMYEDSDYTYVLADLGILYDGKPVYAAAKGTYDEDEKSFNNGQYYIVFEYSAGWCEVSLDSQKAEEWEWSDFEDAFDQIFE